MDAYVVILDLVTFNYPVIKRNIIRIVVQRIIQHGDRGIVIVIGDISVSKKYLALFIVSKRNKVLTCFDRLLKITRLIFGRSFLKLTNA